MPEPDSNWNYLKDGKTIPETYAQYQYLDGRRVLFARTVSTAEIRKRLGIPLSSGHDKKKWKELKADVLECCQPYKELITNSTDYDALSEFTHEQEFDLVVTKICRLPRLQELTDTPIRVARWLAQHTNLNPRNLKDRKPPQSATDHESVIDATSARSTADNTPTGPKPIFPELSTSTESIEATRSTVDTPTGSKPKTFLDMVLGP